ncbi:MAG TPA: autotransporter domain-containing protein, partial [Oceanospirillales bacterium]|nr:autotransporter domain-containing protein [Oceanospirillales bacterium]
NVSSPAFVGNVNTVVQANIQGQLGQTASEMTTIIPGSGNVTDPDVSITKNASENILSFGQPFGYTLTVKNNSTVVATGLSVQDNLPAGLILESIDAGEWSCNNSSNMVCTLAQLNPGRSSTIVVNVFAPSQKGTISNTAQVSINETDANPANNSSQANVTVSSIVADLEIIKTASIDTVTSGEEFSWDIEVVNHGPDSADLVVIDDQLPAGFELSNIVSDSDVKCLAIGTDINCEMLSLEVEKSRVIKLFGIATLSSGVIDNIAEVKAETSDIDNSNNTSMASIVVREIQNKNADLSVAIQSDSRIHQGEASQFQLQLTNHGPDEALQPTVNIQLTGLIDRLSVTSSPVWNCETTDTNVICQFIEATMPAGSASSITVRTFTREVVLDSENLVMNASIASTTNDPVAANNTATSQVGVDSTPTRDNILDAMRSALAGRGNTQVNRAIRNVSSYCERKFFNALDGLCRDLYDAALEGDGETISNVMEQITPNEVIGQSTSVAEIATAQFRNVGARLSQLRGGGGAGFSTAGLNARYGSGSLPLGMLAYLNKSEDDKESSSITDDFISPWGFFVNGTISMGERDATGRELGFDFDSYGLTAGVDYRLDDKKVIGLAVGYANFDSKIDKSAELNSTSLTLTGYGSFYVNDNFYIDARISLSRPKFDQKRNINFNLRGIDIQRTAVGSTTANQYSVAMSAGYNFYRNAWNITPNASFNYVKTNIDGFEETGAGGFNFTYSDQDLESLVWSAGVKVSKAISLKKGVITPQFDFDYNYEGKNDGTEIEARFTAAPIDELFIIETDSPDRVYGSAGLGFVYIAPNGKQAYINYKSVLGLDGFSRGTFNLGARFEF